MVRRLVALAGAVLLLILLVVLVRGCQRSAKEDALRTYARDASALVGESNQRVGRELVDVLGGGGSAVEVESELNRLREAADDQLERAEAFEVRDELVDAHRNLLTTLGLRAEAVRAIAGDVRSAKGSEDSAAAVERIAGQGQTLLASDVLWLQRARPLTDEALRDADVAGVDLTRERFLTELGWIEPTFVAERLGADAPAEDQGGSRGEPAPGTHGHGLASVAIGDTTLQPSPATNRVSASGRVAFTVGFQNQGENDERDVRVRVRITGGPRRIEASAVARETTAGQDAEVEVPLRQAPPIGTPVTIQVVVDRVPGEEKVDNNRQRYTAVFTR